MCCSPTVNRKRDCNPPPPTPNISHRFSILWEFPQNFSSFSSGALASTAKAEPIPSPAVSVVGGKAVAPRPFAWGPLHLHTWRFGPCFACVSRNREAKRSRGSMGCFAFDPIFFLGLGKSAG